MRRDQIIKKIVAYLRLSKPKKGKNKQETIQDAYGIEVQRRSIERFAEFCGAEIVAWFVEIDSGKKENRVELQKAIRKTRMHKATLVIGKQDRLGRNVHLISWLISEKIPFVSADRPDADKMEIYFRAIIDEEERDRISKRTKDGLAEAKASGVLLGSARPGHWKGREKKRGCFHGAGVASGKARTQRAIDAYSFLVEDIREMLAKDMTLSEVAAKLNELGHRTTVNMPFTKQNLSRILHILDFKKTA